MPEFAAKQPKALCCGAVKTETERNMLLENVEKYMIWLFFYSVVGWIYESTLCSVRAHKFINRGFLNGPYCPIYGWGAVLDILILGKVQNPVLLFFLGAIVTCSLEYFTSYIMENFFMRVGGITQNANSTLTDAFACSVRLCSEHFRLF